MKDIWQSITVKLQQIAPEILNNLNKGASDEDLNNLENVIKVKLPSDFRDFYRIYNGQSPISAGLIEGEELLSIERILDEWGVWRDLYDKDVFVEDNGQPFTSQPDKGIKIIGGIHFGYQ